jgi:hypothetical protein
MEEIILVRRKLLDAVGFKTASVSVIIILKEDIFNEIGENIGFNTLRRFFGLLPMKRPHSKTWVIFKTYLEKKRIFSDNKIVSYMREWEAFHRLQFLLSNEEESLTEFLLGMRGNDKYPMLLGTATNYYIYAGNTSVLDQIYTRDELFQNYEKFSDYLSEIVGVLMRKLEKTTFERLIAIFCLPNFKKAVLYFYIDYQHLNGYYGRLLHSIEPSSSSERLFIDCMLGYKEYLNGKNIPFIPLVKVDELKSFYPVLSGRYIGYLIMENKLPKQEIIQHYIKPLLRYFKPHHFFIEVFTALILVKDFHTIRDLIDAYYEDLYEIDHWYAHQTLNIYVIGEGLLYLSEGNVKRAQIVFESIQLNLCSTSYYMYVKHFYNILNYHLHVKLQSPTLHIETILSEIDKDMAITGFNGFSRHFVQSYFE